MRTYIALMLTVLLAGVGANANAESVWHVDKSQTANEEDGESWETAFTTIQPAIDAAYEAGGGEVWVAEGVYDEQREWHHPQDVVRNTGALRLRDHVEVYGGFVGTESDSDTRDASVNETVIDGSKARDGEAAYHVAVGASNAVLDGFVIQGGKANEGLFEGYYHNLEGRYRPFYNGGALKNTDVLNLIVRDCVFQDNTAVEAGAAIYNRNSEVVITDSRISENGGASAVVSEGQGKTTIRNVLFRENPMALRIIGGDVLVDGSVFEDNGKHGEDEFGDSPVVLESSDAMTIQDSIFENNVAKTGGALTIYGRDARIIRSDFVDNTAGSTGGAISLRARSIEVAECVFVGNTAEYGGALFASHRASVSRIVNGVFWRNYATKRGGAVSAVGRLRSGGMMGPRPEFARLDFINCTFNQNTAEEYGGAISHGRHTRFSIWNSIFWDNGPDSFYFNESILEKLIHTSVDEPFPLDNTSENANVLDGNPGFRDANNGDLRLEEGAPGINAGDPDIAPDRDVDGRVRPWDGGVDLGAHEHDAPEGGRVPSQTGQTVEEAQDAVLDAGLTVGTVTEVNDDNVLAGHVIDFSPEPDSMLLPDESVDITVSLGPDKPVEIPDVRGMAPAQAQARLISAHLTPGELDEGYSGHYRAGEIMALDPAPTNTVNPGSSVSLTVSVGPDPNQEPIPIATIDELQRIGDSEDYPLGAAYVLTQSIDAVKTAGSTYGVDFEPIGKRVEHHDLSEAFWGQFDGQGHTIAGLTIKQEHQPDVGLFGAVTWDAEIRNVHLIDVNIEVTEYRARQIGGLVGYCAGHVENSSVQGSVSGHGRVGGLIGKLTGRNLGGSVSNSYTHGAVDGSSSVGGLVGSVQRDASISESFSTSFVHASSSGGGLVGSLAGKIERSFAAGDVSVRRRTAGGLTGGAATDAMVVDSYATGSVTGSGDTIGVGSLIGRCANTTVLRSYTTGTVSGGRDQWTGGLLGTYRADDYVIESSFWDVETTGQTSSVGGEGLPTEEMMRQDVYDQVGWDFTETWSIDEGDSYPYLRYEDSFGAVPDVTGATIDEAESVIAGAGFELTLVREDYSSDVPKGEIIRQGPSPGTLAPLGSAVSPVVSSAGPILNLVEGLTFEEARQELQEAGLILGEVTHEYSESVPEDEIISLDYKPGELESGAGIDLVVSLGPEMGEVPDAVGLPFGEALDLFDEAGFDRVDQEWEFTSGVPEEEVFAQDPEVGESVSLGDQIELRISRGEDAKVPELMGLSLDAAEDALEEAGLTLGAVREDKDPDFSYGVVIYQSSTPGRIVGPEHSIDLTINSSSVPGDVTGNGVVNARDIQIVINKVLGLPVDERYDTDQTKSGVTDASDIQTVINAVLGIE